MRNKSLTIIIIISLLAIGIFVDWNSLFQSGSLLEFSIVGQDNYADSYPIQQWSYSQGQLIYRTASDLGICSSGHGLFDVYEISGSGGWNPKFETKDSISLSCPYSGGCGVELYCMPHDFCTSDSQCNSWIGIGSTCETKNQVDPYVPLKTSNGQTTITSYKYCTVQCSEPNKVCWGLNTDSSNCVSRTYNCGYTEYDNLCGGVQGTAFPYDSQTECRAEIVQPIVCGNGVCESGETSSSCPSDCEENIPNVVDIVKVGNPIVTIDGCTVKGSVILKNQGTLDMDENNVIEMQVVDETTNTQSLFSLIGPVQTCNLNTPWNVHQTYKLDAGEQLTITLISPISGDLDAGRYSVHFVTASECFSDPNEVSGIRNREPFSYPGYTASTITLPSSCQGYNPDTCSPPLKNVCNDEGTAYTYCDANGIWDKTKVTTCAKTETCTTDSTSNGFCKPLVEDGYCDDPITHPNEDIDFSEDKECSVSRTKEEYRQTSDAELLMSLCNTDTDTNCGAREGYNIECSSQSKVGREVKLTLYQKLFSDTRWTFGAKPGLCLATLPPSPTPINPLQTITDWIVENQTIAIMIGIFLLFLLLSRSSSK